MRSLSKFVPFNSSIWKFLTFNTGLPLFDMGTDFRTFFFYLSVASFHPNWAMLTLGWILVSPEIPKPRYIPNRRYRMFFSRYRKISQPHFVCDIFFFTKYCKISQKYHRYYRYRNRKRVVHQVKYVTFSRR